MKARFFLSIPFFFLYVKLLTFQLCIRMTERERDCHIQELKTKLRYVIHLRNRCSDLFRWISSIMEMISGFDWEIISCLFVPAWNLCSDYNFLYGMGIHRILPMLRKINLRMKMWLNPFYPLMMTMVMV